MQNSTERRKNKTQNRQGSCDSQRQSQALKDYSFDLFFLASFASLADCIMLYKSNLVICVLFIIFFFVSTCSDIIPEYKEGVIAERKIFF